MTLNRQRMWVLPEYKKKREREREKRGKGATLSFCCKNTKEESKKSLWVNQR